MVRLSCCAEFAGGNNMASARLVFFHISSAHAAAEPLYDFLKAKQSGFLVSDIKWNFTKFLVCPAGVHGFIA